MPTDKDNKGRGEVIYGLAFMTAATYIFVVNFLFEPSSLREWFLRTIPFEIAAANLMAVALLILCLSVFSARFPLFVRYGLLAALFILGSFLKVSGDMAPVFAFILLAIAVAIYLFVKLRRKRRREPS
jgi:hypothetical protein